MPIEQAKLADALGFGCWWNVEHHGAPGFSYSSAPEMMPVLLSQHTERLRFGHSGILAPFRINHPLRVAERAAFADIASGGAPGARPRALRRHRVGGLRGEPGHLARRAAGGLCA